MAYTNTILSTQLDPKVEESLLEYLLTLATQKNSTNDFRTRYESIDRRAAREKNIGDKDLEFKVPIIAPQLDSMTAFLSKMFLNTPEIFPMVALSPDNKNVSEQFNILITQYAITWQWRRNLLKAFNDGNKYNLMAVEATWDFKRKGVLPAQEAQERKDRAVTEPGFNIRHLDLYNTFWDTTVLPAEVSEKGDFAGYVESLTTMQLRRKLELLEYDGNFSPRINQILESQPATRLYHIPDVIKSHHQAESDIRNNKWATMLDETDDGKLRASAHEVITIYARIIPKERALNFAYLPEKRTPQIWKFIIVNGKFLVYAERRSNIHDYLPIVLGQPRESGLGYQTKSLAEDVADIQNIASTLYTLEIESSRRIISDRGLYNPSMISEKHINSPNVTAKIPVKPLSHDQKLSDAYQQIPYEDRALGTRIPLVQYLTNFANVVSGQNQVQQGEFIKGNKTNAQFAQVMQNSDARQLTTAMLLNDQFFSVIKHLLKSDLLQFQESGELFDSKEQKSVPVDAATLRQSQAEFIIADGLQSIDQLMNTEGFMVALQTIQSSELLQQGYNVPQLFAYLMSLIGVKGLDKFLLTPEQNQGTMMPSGSQTGIPAPTIMPEQ